MDRNMIDAGHLFIFIPILLMSGCVQNYESTDQTRVYENPVSQHSIADPSLIRSDNDLFYVYATGRNGVIFKSADLVSWEQVGEIFTEEDRPDFLDNGDIWAPDINYINGQYVLYYSLSRWGEEFQNGIGVAVSYKPEGPFTDLGKLFNSTDIRVQNSIDPFFITDNNRNYLFWGSFKGIYGIELTEDGLNILPGAEKKKIAGIAYEGTYIHKKDGFYYFLGSILTCCEGKKSLYTTVVARSEDLFGPYKNKIGGRLLDNFHETLILGNSRFAGTGHNSEIITDKNGRDWIMYHAYERKDDLFRKLMLDQIHWQNGWPYVHNSTASFRSEVPVF